MDERLKIPKEWINIGDSNPERHGGIFVKWERDMWHIITTRHYADLPNGLTENEHMFEHSWMEDMDIFQSPNYTVSDGLNEWAVDQLESFSSSPFDFEPINNPELIPENESHGQYLNWVLDNHANWFVTSMTYAYQGYYGGDRPDFESDYWGYLESYGIDKEKF